MSDVGCQIFYVGFRMSDILCGMSDVTSKFAQRSQKNSLAQPAYVV